MRIPVVALLLALPAAPLLAQGSGQRLATHLTDTAQVVLETRLGGDSSQVAQVKLRPGATYLVASHTPGARLSIRHFAHHGTPVPPLDTVPRQPGDTITGWETFRIAAGEGGDHTVELTNPAVGITSVKILLLHRAPGDTLPTTLQHELVFSDNVGPTPIYVTLDSGVTYRIISTVDVFISPRRGGAPPFDAAFADMGAAGVPFRAPLGGEFKIQTEGDDGSVRIYKEASDQVANRCEHVGGSGCGYRPHLTTRSVVIAFAFIPLVALLGVLFK